MAGRLPADPVHLVFIAEGLRKGAAGYLLKESAARTLVEAVVTVSKGRRYLDADIGG